MLPPAYGGHEHVWEHISFGVVGCRLCGTVHACECGDENVVPCAKVFNADSSAVCMYTAMVIQPSALMDAAIDVDGYNKNREQLFAQGDTRAAHRQSSYEENVASLAHEVDTSMRQLLCSDTARSCRTAEVQRYRKKINNALQVFVHKNEGYAACGDLTLAFEFAIGAVRAVRAPEPQLKELAPAHFDALRRALITILYKLCIVHLHAGRINTERVHTFVVGMLYIAVHGLSARQVQLLRPHDELRELVPLQSMLQEFFHLHPKLVTDCENTVKRYINEASDCEFEDLVASLRGACQHTNSPD